MASDGHLLRGAGHRYAMTRWGRAQHLVWLDVRGEPEPLTVCGRRWAFIGEDRIPRYPLCADCQGGRRCQ